MFKEPSGKAVNNYELWAEDIDLATGLGLNAYRFSVEWARVEPVEGKFSDEELDHYEAIVDRCVELGLAPVVTLNHFTAPHWFAMRGGWLDPEAPALFARYCDKVIERFGDRIAYAVTLNEPNLAHLLTWFRCPTSSRSSTGPRWPPRARRPVCRRTAWPTSRSPRRWTRWRTGWPRGTWPLGPPSRRAGRSCRSASRSRSWTTSWSATTRRYATASGPRSTSGGSSSRG